MVHAAFSKEKMGSFICRKVRAGAGMGMVWVAMPRQEGWIDGMIRGVAGVAMVISLLGGVALCASGLAGGEGGQPADMFGFLRPEARAIMYPALGLCWAMAALGVYRLRNLLLAEEKDKRSTEWWPSVWAVVLGPVLAVGSTALFTVSARFEMAALASAYLSGALLMATLFIMPKTLSWRIQDPEGWERFIKAKHEAERAMERWQLEWSSGGRTRARGSAKSL